MDELDLDKLDVSSIDIAGIDGYLRNSMGCQHCNALLIFIVGKFAD